MKTFGIAIIIYSTIILLMTSLFLGCDRGYRDDMIHPLGADQITDKATIEIPEGITILPSDEIYLCEILPESVVIFESTADTITDERVKTYFSLVSQCVKTHQDVANITLQLAFTDRGSREQFKASLPKWGIWKTTENILIVNDTWYFYINVKPSLLICGDTSTTPD